MSDIWPAGFAISGWKPHFAWLPVKTYDGHWRWFTWVKVRRAGTLDHHWEQYSD